MSEITRVALFGKLEHHGLQGHRKRDRLLQAARKSVRRAGALVPPDPAAAGLRPAPHRPAFRARSVAGWRKTSPRRSTACRAARRRSPISASHVEEAVERGWVFGSLMFGAVAGAHRPSGRRHAEDPRPAQCAGGMSREFDKVKADRLTDEFRRDRRRLARGRAGPRPAEPSVRRPAKPAAPWRRRRWGSRRRCDASPSI